MLVIQKNETLRFVLSAGPSAPWDVNVVYDRRGQPFGGLTDISVAIADGNPVDVFSGGALGDVLDGFNFRLAEIKQIAVSNNGNADLTLTILKHDGTTGVTIQQVYIPQGESFLYNPDLLPAPVPAGTTAERPVLGAGDVGSEYFDTTLGHPIWWDGSQWVDFQGQAV
jgi:hypothetical protein